MFTMKGTSAPKAFVGMRAAPAQRRMQGLTAAAPARPQGRGQLQIRAARVGGVEIPNAKRIETALTYIYGIGPTTAKSIMAETKLENKRTRELSEEQLTMLREAVNQFTIEGDLRRMQTMSIKRLVDIQCYRGKRHRAGLPVRGQNTRTNARTRKGKKVTVAGKKKAVK